MRAERINALARLSGAKRYLEVGVCEGDTFFKVNIPFKVAVDPAFLFDYKSKEDKNTKFFPLTSDHFFRDTKLSSFDIIYLDGLHTFDQVARDFFNSMRLAHDKTIWVLDDTIPNDVFAADPDQDRCYRLRRKMGNGDWAWMGDVFKTVFFIERALPFLHFRTFEGHGQTVVWKGNISRSITSDSIGLANVGLMTYEDMIENLERMQIASDETIYQAIKSALF